jgi:hypothetical protein
MRPVGVDRLALSLKMRRLIFFGGQRRIGNFLPTHLMRVKAWQDCVATLVEPRSTIGGDKIEFA